MKVPAVYLYSLKSGSNRQNQDFLAGSVLPSNVNIKSLSGIPYYYPINFTSIQNSGKLRILFEYGLPCMYSGIPMIDPKQVSKMLKNGTLFKPAGEVIPILSRFEDSITGMEKRAFDIIRQRAKIHPEKNLQEILQEIEPVYKKDLRSYQAPIFKELDNKSKLLPQDLQKEYEKLMIETRKKLKDEPVRIPFSSYEFKYKLVKIKDDVVENKDLKSKKVINKLLKESKKLALETNNSTIEHQRKVIGLMDWILKKSVLKDNKALRDLIDISKARLSNEEVKIPFSRKSFIYDLARVLDKLPDENLKKEFMEEAQKLPTSAQSISAYILKTSAESSEKIGFRLLWPSMASVEHIFPKSCGGQDIMANFGGATTRENSMRKSIDFTEQLKLRPNTPKYCQKYVDRLIELYKQGVFQKYNISPKYIPEFKKTIYELSNHTIDLDIKKYYEPVQLNIPFKFNP